MKIGINKSAKRVLSIALALSMLIGSLFTANVGITINAGAETTETTVEKTKILYWDANASYSEPKDSDGDGVYEITSVAELNYVCTGRAADFAGKSYKVADDIKAFVLQPNTVITDLEAFKALDAQGVADFFANTTPVNWIKSYPSVFNGNFDGNGVEIYGLYCNAAGTPTTAATGQSAALFPTLEGGKVGDNGDGSYVSTKRADHEITVYYDNDGISIGNFALRNGYIKGYQRAAAIFATTNSSVWAKDSTSDTSANYHKGVDGRIKLSGCEVGNCYIEGVKTYYSNKDGATAEYTGAPVDEKGILLGSCNGGDIVQISDCFVYGNKGVHEDTTASFGLYGAIGKNDGGQDNVQRAVQPYISNTVVLGVDAYKSSNDGQDCTYTNVYSDTGTAKTGVIKLASADAAKGMVGRVNMGGLNWADAAENPDDGSTYWYAQKDDYPTLIRPADDYWKSINVPSIWGGGTATEFAGGTGTKEDPYIIKTADQLYLALTQITDTTNNVAGGKQTDSILQQGSTTVYVPVYTPYYYKVADGVESLYLGSIFGNETTDGIHTAVTDNKITEWNPGKSFVGHLDGNGVTIYGMYSKGAGLIYKLDGSATVKNINFEACYTNRAMLTKQLGTYLNDSTLITVSNISVRNCCLHSDATHYIDKNTSAVTGASLISTGSTCENLTISNCLFDGISCDLTQGTLNYTDRSSGEEVINLLTADTAYTNKIIGGIISGGSSMNNVSINGCVSLGAPIVDEVYYNATGTAYTQDVLKVNYTRYDKNQGFQVYFYNCYSDIPASLSALYPGQYDKLLDIERVAAKDDYTMSDMPMFAWGMNWQLVEADDRTIPMPMVRNTDTSVDYSTLLSQQLDGKGASTNSGVSGFNGKYGWQTLFTGSGTEKDPYLITNALELARAIGSGGESMDYPLYYKLACDIDIDGATWINQVSVGNTYAYVPFSGTLDGAGYSVSNFVATDKNAAGLIPVLDGGTVKNLHIRNSYAGSTNVAGLIAGEVKANSTIENCSVEGSEVVATTTNTITGSDFATSNSYYVVNGAQTFSADADTTKLYPADDAVWYKGTDGLFRHVSFAKAHVITDVDADGIVDDKYVTNDIVALRNCLLSREGFTNIYGDVSRNGKVNISDLAILRRRMADDYTTLSDGFWRNLELNKFEIYYDENDNYDFARKMQLYLEAIIPEIAVQKYVPGTGANDKVVAGTMQGTPSGDTYINIKTDETLDYDKYKIEYDSTSLILTISGGSFTAVEQAVLDFIAYAKPENGEAGVYTDSGSILDQKAYESLESDGTLSSQSYKQAVEVNGETYYYAWGDEFEGTNTTVNSALWQVRNYKYEEGTGENGVSASEATSNDKYHNLTSPTVDSVKDLWEVNDGKLTIWRGLEEDYYNSKGASVVDWGYKSVNLDDDLDADGKSSFGRLVDDEDVYVDPGLVQTANTMLFKQGYAEMRASVPSDGHAFPAWWFYNGTNDQTNASYDRLLYGKVYEENDAWKTNQAAKIVPGNLSTYRYKGPKAYLEFDIVEFMEAQTGTETTAQSGSIIKFDSEQQGIKTGKYLNYPQLTIHKNYGLHATGLTGATETAIYVPNWSDNTSIPDTYGNFQAIDGDAVNNHRYDHSAFTYPRKSNGVDGKVSGAYNIDGGITKYWTYGFSWWVNEANDTYELTIYVDFDEDGIMQADEKVVVVNQDVGHYNSTDIVRSRGLDEEAKVWNQYAYMLIDNAFYTSNSNGTRTKTSRNGSWSAWTGVTPFTDLEEQGTSSATGNADKATFDIEYVRVYQKNNQRDIVTPETDAFNTGNHFGY